MAEPVPTLDIAAPQLVIVAEGETPGAQSNARGHLFETFIARLFEALGCEPPSVSTLNVKQNGYELDVAMKIALTGEPAIAECKAYSSPLPVGALSGFYGKLHAERLDIPETRGWFVAIPGLTSEGHTLARKLAKGDTRFRLFTATDLYELVQAQRWIEPILDDESKTLSDHAILISKHGICALAKQIDQLTRLPKRVLVSRLGLPVSQPELSLLAQTDYAAGLQVCDMHAPTTAAMQASPSDAVTLVTVVGSKEDFEYQFPASPAYFVGREGLRAKVQRTSEENRDRGISVVLNAQSGWGKSSLALRIAHEVQVAGGASIVFDSRTASSVPFVASALRRALAEAQIAGLLKLPNDASFASLQSAVRTLQSCQWMRPAQLLIFFDQFENVFRDQRLTQEFRDLVLAVREITSPVMLGFCWKTDLVGMTENYPYRLRDEIRSVSLVLNVEPFGPKDVSTLLGRLAKAAGHDLSADLKQRLREYSQGLPWLLKKLASHILKELQSGTSEETLLADALNIESLFEQDLANLEAREQQALRTIAREAPVLVSEIVERVDSGIIQSLVDQRLVVRVGERIDVYWDTFREFLITGKLAVEDTYILRMRAASTSKLLQLIVRQGGEATVQQATAHLSTTQHVIFNNSRELRLLGILSPRSGSLSLSEQFKGRDISEAEIRERVARSLRRHAVFGKIHQLIATSPKSEISIDALAAEMPALFPAVAATQKTWRLYAISFGTWLDYSGLLRLRGQMLASAEASSQAALLGSVRGQRRSKTFPHSRPNASLNYLRSLRVSSPIDITKSARQKALTDLFVLGVLDLGGTAIESQSDLIDRLTCEPPDAAAVRQVLSRVPGGEEALARLTDDPATRPETIGALLRDAFGLPWVGSTTRMAGEKFRAWAKEAGLTVINVPRKAGGV